MELGNIDNNNSRAGNSDYDSYSDNMTIVTIVTMAISKGK